MEGSLIAETSKPRVQWRAPLVRMAHRAAPCLVSGCSPCWRGDICSSGLRLAQRACWGEGFGWKWRPGDGYTCWACCHHIIPGVGRTHKVSCVNVLFRTQCNARKILIKTILQKKFNRTAPAPYLLPVFPPMFTFSSCHFPYVCQNFPFWGMITLGIWLSSVYQQNLFCTLFLYHSSHLKAQFKQVTKRYKWYKEI